MRPASALRLLLALTFVAALLVNIFPLFRPLLWGDDLEILVRSWTWELTCAAMWEPQNEHAMPLGRLSTRALVVLADQPTWLPLFTGLQGPIAQLTVMALLHLFVRRELDDARLALLATALFGVTSLYHQAIYWFAASFSLLALATLLLALLAAQNWRRSGRWYWLAVCGTATAVAPAWFASGLLAGPLCALYLLAGMWAKYKAEYVKSGLLALVPILGTCAFLAVSLPRTAEYILHLEHYQGRDVRELFKLPVGFWYTARSLVDNLLLGQCGVSGVRCPVWLLPLGWAMLGGLAVWWWQRAPHRRLLVLGLGFILSSYLLVYTARAGWDYDEYDFSTPTWGRYHLLPQLGLSLYLVGGLKPDAPLSRRHVREFALLLAGLVALHLPRVVIQHYYRDPTEQQAALRRIEDVDARCRAQGIDAATAKAALGWLEVPDGSPKENGWDFLRGSDSPRPLTVEQVRRLLDASAE
jgi:hypothetical protein